MWREIEPHSDELMASEDTVGVYAASTTRSPPRFRPNPVTISNVQSNFVSQPINNPNIQFNTVQPFSAPTMPVLATNHKISGSLPEGATMPVFHTMQAQHSIQNIAQGVVSSNVIQQQQQQQTQFDHLKVEDALIYLEQIKLKFCNQPGVYNDFLAIMKQFKAQSIDTLGVVTRVSNLFKSYPELMLGFNTFLPSEYKIEIKNNELGFEVSIAKSQSSVITSYQTIIHSTTQHMSPIVTTPPVTLSTTPSVVIKSEGHLPINHVNTTSVVMNHQSAHKSVTTTTSSSSIHPQVSIPMTQKSTNSQNRPVQFCHAIDYVSKIKNRFQGQPEKYKKFLEILHIYQKDQKTLKDNIKPIIEKTLTEVEVYQQVTELFENQDDLLVEFGLFLPDAKQDSEVKTAPKKISVDTTLKYSTETSEESNNATTAPPVSDLLTEIDYSICKRLGESYCEVPSNYQTPKCSGRTKMCNEVLNDTCVSFPMWSGESLFTTCRKSRYEEYMHKCEDRRFELDLIMEINLSAIYSLEEVNKKCNKMTPDQISKFKLDDTLGNESGSTTTNKRAIRRIYGDYSPDIIEGLKQMPAITIPIVLKRLKSKDEEWKKARNNFNELWKRQNEKYFLKLLKHQQHQLILKSIEN